MSAWADFPELELPPLPGIDLRPVEEALACTDDLVIPQGSTP